MALRPSTLDEELREHCIVAMDMRARISFFWNFARVTGKVSTWTYSQYHPTVRCCDMKTAARAHTLDGFIGFGAPAA